MQSLHRVEKSPSPNGTSRIGAEISGLRVSIEPNTFALISTCSSARDDIAENSLLLFFAIFCIYKRSGKGDCEEMIEHFFTAPFILVYIGAAPFPGTALYDIS